ncbi:MAG: hypothetical protein VB061_10925 [Christensenella sp.]|nr:hypothetical protein [Christensenella sp.]
MQIDGAKIREQGVTFGIIVVKPSVISNTTQSSEMQAFGRKLFGTIPIILAAQDSSGRFTYYGRTDIVKFLSNVSPSRIPWQTYTIS